MTSEEIIKSNTGLIYKIMNDYFYGVEREDLFNQGVVGLLKAYKNYKINNNTKFSSYAFSFIFGEMYQLATQKQIKVSKDILKLYKSIEKVRYTLAQKLNRIPSNQELAIYLEEDINKIEQALEAGSIIVSSLDKGSIDDRSIYETISYEEDISIDDKILLNEGLEKLTEDERKIIEYRYFKDLTQSEVARKLHKTQVMVSRYESKGLNKIRDYYTT